MALLVEGDLVAIEAKYHRNCYTRSTRQYNVICKQNTVSENLQVTAENELLQLIKDEVARDCREFTLQDLTDLMTEGLQQHKIQLTVNRTFHKGKSPRTFSKYDRGESHQRPSFHRLFEDS